MVDVFLLCPSNEGTQVLLYSDKALNVIVRNQQRQCRDTKKYRITVEEVK